MRAVETSRDAPPSPTKPGSPEGSRPAAGAAGSFPAASSPAAASAAAGGGEVARRVDLTAALGAAGGGPSQPVTDMLEAACMAAIKVMDDD
jgi:hypothetical protein